MDRHTLRDELVRRLTALVSEEMFDLWDVELGPQSGRTVVRVLLDRPSGVTLDDCANWNRKIGRYLDAEDVMPGSYILEVGSPGIERVLSRPAHFARFLGSQVELRLHDPRDGRRTFRGELREAGEDSVTVVDAESGPVTVPYAAIRRARRIADPWEGLRSQERRAKGKRR
jgi:ribosome maturation factor RimP